MDAELATRIAELILPSLHREYPNKPGNVVASDADVRPPRALYPIFYGCFDWHSAVHSHWALIQLVARFPDADWADDARVALSRSFTPENVAGELATLTAPHMASFEMPYGVAWLLQLCADAGPWSNVLAPLARAGADRFRAWLPRLTHPLRDGQHANSAFAMGLVYDAAPDDELRALVVRRAVELYGDDGRAPVELEPSAFDFVSPALAEADLMRRVLPRSAFEIWRARFFPTEPELEPVASADPSDGKLAHFDGLNLSRAWMLANLGYAERAHAHARAGLAALTAEHYMSSHWLGTFAVYLLRA